jgi:limonene-1,2-epoxide hydrolase
VIQRWIRAIDERDVDGAVACFSPDYLDESPAHPNRTFRGQDGVRRNLSAFFAGVPNLRAQILRSVTDGDSVWVEWRMDGAQIDGKRLNMIGVTIFEVRDDRIVSGRFYEEPIEEGGGTIDDALAEMAGQHPT